MKENKNTANMDSEIQLRLDNPEWDMKIAGRVNSSIKIRQKRNRIIALAAPAAAAAVIIFAIFINPGTDPVNDFENLIQNQVTGTYKDVFKEEYTNTYSINGNGSVQYDNIDLLIDNAMDGR